MRGVGMVLGWDRAVHERGEVMEAVVAANRDMPDGQSDGREYLINEGIAFATLRLQVGGIVQLDHQERGERLPVAEDEIDVLSNDLIEVMLKSGRGGGQIEQINEPDFCQKMHVGTDHGSQDGIEGLFSRRQEVCAFPVGKPGQPVLERWCRKGEFI